MNLERQDEVCIDSIKNGLWGADIVKGGIKETIFQKDYLDFVAYFNLCEQPIKGETYTIVWDDLKISGSTDISVGFYFWNGSWNNQIAMGGTSNMGKGNISFKIPEDTKMTGIYRLGVYGSKYNSGGSITNLKVLRSKMTAEDAQDRIIKLESKIKCVYVSSSLGNNNNSGENEKQPVASIARAKELGAKKILLKRNDIFYETVGLGKNILDTYGHGSLPIISGFRVVDSQKNHWIEESTNKWRLDLSSPGIKGYPYKANSDEMNVCHIYDIAQDKIRGDKVPKMENLGQNYQFHQSDKDLSTIHYLYMYLDFDPNTIPLKLASKVKAVSCYESEIRNIRIEGANYGIFAHSTNIIESIEIDCIGGGYHGYTSGGYTRAGNGIEWYTLNGRFDNTVKNCKISRVYDAALTIQGNSTASTRDILIDSNVISNCGQAFEMWSMNNNATPFFGRCVFSNNLCIDNDLGSNGFPTRKIHAFLLSYNMDMPANMTFENNVFFNGNLYYYAGRTYNDNKKYSFKRNTLYAKRGQYLIGASADINTVYIPENEDPIEDMKAINKYRELADDYSTRIIIMDSNLATMSEVLKLTKI